MAKWKGAAFWAAVGLILPNVSHAQGVADEINSMHGVLQQIYDEMIPLCSQLISVAQGIAGFAALFYIAFRVWQHIANAEPVDFYPLFRPFVLGFCIMNFPMVLAMINGVMKPTVIATAEMVEGSDQAIAILLERKEQAIMETDAWKVYVGESGSGDRDKWYKYTYEEDPSTESLLTVVGNNIRFFMEKQSYNFRNSVKEWLSEVLRILFEAAALCIDTLRTFQMVVLAILGPLVFGLAVFDGFHHTLSAWLARYINIFLWLPVANIFGAILGKIQQKMIALDIAQLQEHGGTLYSRTDIAYLVFLIIGIVGYFTVPSVANYIVHAGGGGGALGHKVTSLFGSSTSSAVSATAAGAGVVTHTVGKAAGQVYRSLSGRGGSSGSGGGSYMNDKLRGNS